MKKLNLKEKNYASVIPIIFAVDDNYAPFLAVTLKSIAKKSSKDKLYKIFVLNAGLNEDVVQKLTRKKPKNFEINFIDVNAELDKISSRLFVRDYYSNATYYRFFIPDIFPEYEKMLYLDSDIILLDDVAKLYEIDTGENLIGAVQDDVITEMKIFSSYVEDGLGLSKDKYFNAGVALMNLKEMRKFGILSKFLALVEKHKFEVAQDQDYLNVLCAGRVKIIEQGWNKTPFKDSNFDKDSIKLVHFKLCFKPWHYDDLDYAKYFWRCAKKTPFYGEILAMKKGFTVNDRARDDRVHQKLVGIATAYVKSANSYKNLTKGLS